MNREDAYCQVCGRAAQPQELLDCAFCGRWFHVPRDDREGCGVVAPNPASENGC